MRHHVGIFLLLALGMWSVAEAVEISNVSISEITNTSATVEWQTNVNADATINYGLDPNVGLVRDPLFDKKQHTLTIDELTPGTTYYFRVLSTDEEGNKGATAGFVFTTRTTTKQKNEVVESIKDPEQKVITEEIIEKLDRLTDPAAVRAVVDKVSQVAGDILKPPAIVGAPKVVVDATEATITWVTDRDSGSMVYLASVDEYDPNVAQPYGIIQGDPNERVLRHVVHVIGLEPSTTYHFKVVSVDDYNLFGETEDDTFKTRAIRARIQNATISRIQEHSAVVSWDTSGVPAKGVVEYTNTRTKETKSAGDPVFTTNHSVRLTDLEFGTRYSVVITAINDGGEEASSDTFTFVTVRDVLAPEISKVKNESTLYPGEETKIQTIIGWETDEPAACQVFYIQGLIRTEETAPDSLDKEPNPTTSHTQVVVGFAPATVYKFWMVCTDESGNESQSEDFVLITPVKEKSIIDIILENFEGTFGWVKNITN